jgi:hypothetical protein
MARCSRGASDQQYQQYGDSQVHLCVVPGEVTSFRQRFGDLVFVRSTMLLARRLVLGLVAAPGQLRGLGVAHARQRPEGVERPRGV